MWLDDIQVLQDFVVVVVAYESQEKLSVIWNPMCSREARENWLYHAKWLAAVEFEFVEATSDMGDIRYFEYRLEPDALLPDISALSGFGTEPKACQGSKLLEAEA